MTQCTIKRVVCRLLDGSYRFFGCSDEVAPGNTLIEWPTYIAEADLGDHVGPCELAALTGHTVIYHEVQSNHEPSITPDPVVDGAAGLDGVGLA